MILRRLNPALLAVLTGTLLLSIFSAMVLRFRAHLREEIRETIINRAAAILLPVAQRQLARSAENATTSAELLAAVLESAQQEDMLGIVVYDSQGRVLRYAPEALLFADLKIEDYLRLIQFEPISRFSENFPLSRYFAGFARSTSGGPTPVLEVLLPLHGKTSSEMVGVAQYYIYADSLARELASIDQRVNRQTAGTLGAGAALIAIVIAGAYIVLNRSHQRLVKTNRQLNLAVKASTVGQITAHLIHGLQGVVASLRALISSGDSERIDDPDWKTASGYTDLMQGMIHEAVAFLGDFSSDDTHELSGAEISALIEKRNAGPAAERGISFHIIGGFDHGLDSHRAGLLCLITNNLVQNALEASDAGGTVSVVLRSDEDGESIAVTDRGRGIPETLREHLFEPGRTSRPGGSGLGLAISQLLAQQMGASLILESTGTGGTTFRLTLPLVTAGL